MLRKPGKNSAVILPQLEPRSVGPKFLLLPSSVPMLRLQTTIFCFFLHKMALAATICYSYLNCGGVFVQNMGHKIVTLKPLNVINVGRQPAVFLVFWLAFNKRGLGVLMNFTKTLNWKCSKCNLSLHGEQYFGGFFTMRGTCLLREL